MSQQSAQLKEKKKGKRIFINLIITIKKKEKG